MLKPLFTGEFYGDGCDPHASRSRRSSDAKSGCAVALNARVII
jgi:hypothetical protein